MKSVERFQAIQPSSKLTATHLERWALVYIRQSTPQQVVEHQESTRIQYALKDRALALGWEGHRISVIDEDLGHSGATVEGRPGFQRLVAEVSLDHVGIILGAEVSRFARSCRDWYQLLDVCALFGTLIADLDGIYDPANHNDRLLLGLKGTMSEAELHLLKRRMLDGRRAKAQRGELAIPLPSGYVRSPSGKVLKDPDERAQFVVAMIFQQFTAIGTAYGVLRYLVSRGLGLPVREQSGPCKGELSWRRPASLAICNMLNNPAYAGAYAVGRSLRDPKKRKPGRAGSGRTKLPMEQWAVLLQDRIPAYITWEDFLHNRERLWANAPTGGGSVRKGSSLLAGLVVCGKCGLRMCVLYSKYGMRYVCSQACIRHAEPICQSLVGRCLDEEVERQILKALEPAALEISMAVAADLEARRVQDETLWRQRLQQAKYEAERAQRQYNAVEPENRMVVRTLERDWESALQAKQKVEEAYDQYRAMTPTTMTQTQREAIQTLAKNIPAIWHAPTTTAADKKEIIRQLIDWVKVTVVGKSEQVQVTIRWGGDHETQAMVARPVRRLENLSYLEPVLERIQGLRQDGKTSEEVAQALNEDGWQTGMQKGPITASWVRTLLSRRGLTKKTRGRETEPESQGGDHDL